MAKLTFKNKDLLKLVEITEKGTEFRPAYTSDKSKKPIIYLVKDDGIYLMPAVIDYERPADKSDVVYAKGYNPNTDGDVYDKCRAAVGGDDFAEDIEFPVHFREHIKKGSDLVLKVTPEHIIIEVN